MDLSLKNKEWKESFRYFTKTIDVYLLGKSVEIGNLLNFID